MSELDNSGQAATEDGSEVKAANPQLENGYTRIANEIMEALADKRITGGMTSYGFYVLLAVVRKTYGYRKKADWISNSQLVEMTGIGKQHISRTMKALCDRRFLLRSGKMVGLNKNYHEWVKTSKREKLPNEVTPGLSDRKGKLPPAVTKVTSLDDKSNLVVEPQKKKKENNSVSPEDPGSTPLVFRPDKQETEQSGHTPLHEYALASVHGTETGFEHETGEKVSTETAVGRELSLEEITAATNRSKTGQARKPKKNTDSRVSEAIKYYSEVCQELKGYKPKIDGGKDGKNIKAALETMDLTEIKECIRFFLKSEKSKSVGVSLSAALTSHTVNLYRGSANTAIPEYKRQYA